MGYILHIVVVTPLVKHIGIVMVCSQPNIPRLSEPMTHLGMYIVICFIVNRPGRFQIASVSGIPPCSVVRYEHDL